jgi:hypothetical protein
MPNGQKMKTPTEVATAAATKAAKVAAHKGKGREAPAKIGDIDDALAAAGMEVV